jgi:putative transposase
MDLLARLLVPSLRHHITQRGNQRDRVFVGDEDHLAYLALIAGAAESHGPRSGLNCLMVNPVHSIMALFTDDGLRQTFVEAHRRCTGLNNARLKRT